MCQCWCGRTSRNEKIFWAILAIFLVGALIYEWVVSVGDLVSSGPIRSRFTYMEQKSRLELPNILVCSSDPINYAAVRNANLQDGAVVWLQQWMYPFVQPSMQVQSWQTNQSYQQYQNLLLQYHGSRHQIFSDFHMQCQNVVGQCRLGANSPPMTGQECCQNSTLKLLPIGVCFVLMTPQQTKPTLAGGFEVTFTVKASNLHSLVASSFQGLNVYLSDSNGHQPFAADLSLTDNGASYEAQLSAPRQVQPTGWWRTSACDRNAARFDATFPFMAALIDCSNSAVFLECGCYPFQRLLTYSHDDAQVCTDAQIPCANRTLAFLVLDSPRRVFNERFYRGSGVCAKILPPCSAWVFDVFSTSKRMVPQPSLADFTVKLTIFYNFFHYTRIEQFYGPNYHDVVIQVGGALVFWLVAMFSLILLVDCLKYLAWRKPATSGSCSSHQHTSKAQVVPDGPLLQALVVHQQPLVGRQQQAFVVGSGQLQPVTYYQEQNANGGHHILPMAPQISPEPARLPAPLPPINAATGGENLSHTHEA